MKIIKYIRRKLMILKKELKEPISAQMMYWGITYLKPV